MAKDSFTLFSLFASSSSFFNICCNISSTSSAALFVACCCGVLADFDMKYRSRCCIIRASRSSEVSSLFSRNDDEEDSAAARATMTRLGLALLLQKPSTALWQQQTMTNRYLASFREQILCRIMLFYLFFSNKRTEQRPPLSFHWWCELFVRRRGPCALRQFSSSCGFSLHSFPWAASKRVSDAFSTI